MARTSGPVPAAEQRFIEIDDPDGTTRWRLDAGFLTSGFRCIWGEGCQGIHAERRPELMDGCCSVGVVLADDDEAHNVVALAATIGPELFQHRPEQPGPQSLLVRHGAHWATAVVDGACVFLNRPGFTGGPGCALHLAAVAAGDEPAGWKPLTCNRVPLRVEERIGTGDAVEVTVRAWRRDDWGPGGATMAWWCTEDPAAFVAAGPLHERIDGELRDLLGDIVLAEFRERLATPTAPDAG